MKIENGSIGKKCRLIEERNLIGNAKNCISITQTNVLENTFAIVKIKRCGHKQNLDFKVGEGG